MLRVHEHLAGQRPGERLEGGAAVGVPDEPEVRLLLARPPLEELGVVARDLLDQGAVVVEESPEDPTSMERCPSVTCAGRAGLVTRTAASTASDSRRCCRRFWNSSDEHRIVGQRPLNAAGL
jgi:hypothetical protein